MNGEIVPVNQFDILLVFVVLFMGASIGVWYLLKNKDIESTALSSWALIWSLVWVLFGYLIYRFDVLDNVHVVILVAVFAMPGIIAIVSSFTEQHNETPKKEMSLEDRIKKMVDDSKK